MFDILPICQRILLAHSEHKQHRLFGRCYRGSKWSYADRPGSVSRLWKSDSKAAADFIFRQYPSNYLVFPTISAGNACTRVGNIYYDHTIAFAPGAISTIEGNTGVTKEFNFADMPCPPPEVAAADSYFYNPQWNPGRPYSPIIAPPKEIFDMDPAFANCVAAVYQGFDPSRAFSIYNGPQNPAPGTGWKPPKRRRGPGHMVPRGPVKTAAPWDS